MHAQSTFTSLIIFYFQLQVPVNTKNIHLYVSHQIYQFLIGARKQGLERIRKGFTFYSLGEHLSLLTHMGTF